MANTPEGAALIDNPISSAPGFRVENVFVMAGVPRIAQAMIDGVKHTLQGGDPVLSQTLVTTLPEGRMAPGLGEIQSRYRSEEHTYELQSLMRNSYAVSCLKKKTH